MWGDRVVDSEFLQKLRQRQAGENRTRQFPAAKKQPRKGLVGW